MYVCAALLFKWGREKVETWQEGRDEKENLCMVNSMCPILSCWHYEGVGGR